MIRKYVHVVVALVLLLPSFAVAQRRGNSTSMKQSPTVKGDVRLITLDPGHFHAALVQKTMYPGVSPIVAVYAPAGIDLDQHLKRIDAYNTRVENPTRWEEKLYTGNDFLQKMIAEKAGNVVVLSGNNREKINYINTSLNAGLNVLADKPMVLDTAGYKKLKTAFKKAEVQRTLLYDIMTERFEITTMLQKALVNDASVFGRQLKGTADNPAVVKESVHHLFKYVSGKPLQRPAWFFDIAQQGEGIVDVTTHLVDLVQWGVFPDVILTPRDVVMLRAKRWPTVVNRDQFRKVTGQSDFPDYLRTKFNKDGELEYYSNGEMIYRLKGVHAKVSVIWNFEAPTGAGDTHFSVIKGSNANIFIRQGKDQNYKPELYVEAADASRRAQVEAALKRSLVTLTAKFPGLQLEANGDGWHIIIPSVHRTDHEAHFAQVMENYLKYLRAGKLPAWEVPNMITKYYTTTRARELAMQSGAGSLSRARR